MPKSKGVVSSLTSSPARGASEETTDADWTVVDEQVLHLEIHGLYQDDILKSVGRQGSETGDIQLTGLETQEPILQIGRQVFAGTYCDSADSSVFFRCTSGQDREVEDEVFSPAATRLSAKLECITKKKLSFKRVFLKHRGRQS